MSAVSCHWTGKLKRGWIYAIPCCLILLLTGFSAFAETPQRIVSLAPSLTELTCALGLEQNLVGITTFCDRPATVKGKTTVGGPSNPSLETVLQLKPDIVLMDEEGIGPVLAKRLKRLGIRTATLHGSRLSKLPTAIRQLGQELEVPAQAEQLAREVEQVSRAKDSSKVVRTLFVIWPDPLIAAGPNSLLDDALQVSAMQNIADDTRSPYPRLSLESIVSRNPQLIIIGQGKQLNQPVQRMLERLKSLEAVQQGRICMVSDALYRSGPRIPEGIIELRNCLKLVD